jgi:uridylate kinase
LQPSDYTVTAPDGRPPTREFARERLARVVCADREMLSDADVNAIAAAAADAQAARVAQAIREVLARHRQIRVAVVTGLGAFIGRRAATVAGLDVVPLADDLGGDAARCAPAACVALLLEGQANVRRDLAASPTPGARTPTVLVDTVIKMGGGLLAHQDEFARALDEIAEVARRERVVIVPGGGPFADAVRAVDGHAGLSDDAAHWMAILAMDQYAHLIVSRIANGALVTRAGEITALLEAGRIPVLAPFDWLHRRDPLPHSWDVTSDSIAAWIAGELGASRLVLLKPPGARGGPRLRPERPERSRTGAVVDAHFASAVPQGVEVAIVPADELSSISKTASTTASG